MTAHVLALTVVAHVPAARSLKDKRSVVRSVCESARSRFAVAVAETDHQDTWQRAELAFVAVSGTVRHCEDVIDGVERFVWSVPELEVLETQRRWMETG